MSEETQTNENDSQITFKVKTSGETIHTITAADSTTVLDLKTTLSGNNYENISADRMRLIYSGRVMKDAEPLSTYKIKNGNTVHMVKSAASNASQRPDGSGSTASSVPSNMAAGTANNPLAGLTGARYAGHVQLPSADIFGADGGMGAPPSEDQIAILLEDPNFYQTMNEAMNNPALVELLLDNIPGMRDNPDARAMFLSPEFRRIMINPETVRRAAAMRRLLVGGAGGANAFPAPGVTDNTPAATSTNPAPTDSQIPMNPFAALLGGQTLPGQNLSTNAPSSTTDTQSSSTNSATPPNPFASLLDNNQNSIQMPPMTPQMVQEAMAMLREGTLPNFNEALGLLPPSENLLSAIRAGIVPGTATIPPAAPAPQDTRLPEEIYANQLRQLNDMGFFDFERNVAALRRSGGSVQGAIEQLLS